MSAQSKSERYADLALIHAALDYRSASCRLLNLHQVLLVYQLGMLMTDYNKDYVRLCQLHDNKYIRFTNIATRLQILEKKGLVYRHDRVYSFTALGWQHYKLLDSLLIRYYPIYKANYQKSAKNIKRSKKV